MNPDRFAQLLRAFAAGYARCALCAQPKLQSPIKSHIFDPRTLFAKLSQAESALDDWAAGFDNAVLRVFVFPTFLGATLMSTVRQEAIKAIACANHQLNRVDFKTNHVKDMFGNNVFNEEVQRQRLPKPIFKALQKTI